MKTILGNDLDLGTAVGTNEPLHLKASDRDKHLYVCGTTGSGKSKFLENLIQQDICEWRNSKCGLLLIDPHGSLYDSLMHWLAWHDTYMKRPVIPIDLRSRDWVVGYNVLRPRSEADPNVIVTNFVQAMAHVWGQSDTSQTPLFNRWASNILSTLYEQQQTLLEAEYLMDRIATEIRHGMTQGLGKGLVANDWAFANSLTPKDFDAQISSTISRFRPFLETQAIRHILGRRGASFDLGEALEKGHIILVCTGTEKGRLSEENASLFSTLLMCDLWAAAKDRGKGNVKPFYLYLDEFQNFVTPTIAKNLDQARGFGLHLTLAHQFPNQLLHTGEHGKEVYDSIMVNARSKVVFSMDGEENLKPLAQSLFRGVMSPDKVKHALYSTKVMAYVEEYRTAYARSKSTGSGHGSQAGESAGQGLGGTVMHGADKGQSSHSDSWSKFKAHSVSNNESFTEAESVSETENPTLIPKMGTELSSIQFESLEEQLFRAMAVLFDQEQRQCVVRTVGSRVPESLFTPTIEDITRNPKRLKHYIDKTLKRWPFAIRTALAKEHLAARKKEIAEQFLPKRTDEEPKTARRKTK